ncbi:1,4-dihydroxy-2-naphthoate polyprenyltransferase [Kitasatospora aureofaciens]|uniref:1,4-dihydroxy-2-naphthoate polyprenyltransferase n=1 Tax=Kitasatospora aureofaciens TaxID=1894 RepID=UPI001C466B1B|nr:1,4-dihydroxy-2-naphthoate polyprenyltransferase [Kitasatospora aureofaciens]MBV6699913.1 1,4-dihydroxy-2-naphthoate polyprenyltransferase [Kitasatospora aureofaciens]
MSATTRPGAPNAVRAWLLGARLKTLPVTLAPIAVGTAVAASDGPIQGRRTALTLVFALGFVLGTNFLNDYSDGIRGADDHRIGPVRLVGSGQASPGQVLRFGLVLYGIATTAGLVMAVTISWWLLALAALCALGGWFYTGGSRPYGYRSLGDVSIFLFHGVIAVCATTYIQLQRVPALAVGASVPMGLLACALLTTNNLRDIPTDTAAGKITIAVRLGDHRTRVYYALLVAAAFAAALALAPQRPAVLLVAAAAPVAVLPLRRVLGGARGADLVPALEHTCWLLLAFGVLLSTGLAL